MTNDDSGNSLEEDLVAWGKVITLHTMGRSSGRMRTATVGFVETPDGSLLVVASEPDAAWAMNLLADGSCQVEREGRRQACVATQLGPSDRNAAIAGLIIRYGTPSERLGRGPAFRLRPTDTLVDSPVTD